MSLALRLQDPNSEETTYLFEAMVDAARNANRLRAVFAFASTSGVDALIEEPEIIGLLKRGRVQLVVGIDAVTSRAALERLHTASTQFKSLEVRVFWNDTRRLFHPKFCVFSGNRHATLIVGSGNLTFGGLQSNYEAFGVGTVRFRRASLLAASVDGWFATHASRLRVIDDAALKRAEKNRVVRRPDAEPDDVDEPVDIVVSTTGEPVLVAEVPRSGDRWNQVNFDYPTIRDYFRVEPGTSERLFLSDRTPGDHFGVGETRPCVYSSTSVNYRVELAAGRGRAYPDEGRPIAVFLRVASRSFRYVLLLPGDTGYDSIAAILPSSGRGNRMRRPVISVKELDRAWPKNALTK